MVVSFVVIRAVMLGSNRKGLESPQAPPPYTLGLHFVSGKRLKMPAFNAYNQWERGDREPEAGSVPTRELDSPCG